MFQVKPQMIYLEFIGSSIRKEIERLNDILRAIDDTREYRDTYILESMRSSEEALRRLRKFIGEN